MTVETGDHIADLDPSAPADTQPLGESNEHMQLIKRVLDTTFQGSVGDLYDDASGSVLVGPIQTNRQPADIANLATEVGLNLDSPGDVTRIDDLEATRVRIDIPVVITENWAFTGEVEFINGPVDFTAFIPQVDGVDVALVDQLTNYLERSRLLITTINADYDTIASDFGKKLFYNGPDGNTITITGGIDTDLIFITNANTTDNTSVLNVTGAVGEFFNLGDDTRVQSFSITGRYRTVGMHKINGEWFVSGDYD